MTTAITPFAIAVPEADLADLRDRLVWRPDRETVDDRSQGMEALEPAMASTLASRERVEATVSDVETRSESSTRSVWPKLCS